ncbi:MAG TPA: nickel permease, partial [Sinorhizobium sp.]|nr:nickel permease [Sinorhizobium sp.]
MNFSWISTYWPLLVAGAVQTVLLLVISVVFGFILAIGLALAQIKGSRAVKWLARGYCTCLRGT